MFSIHHWKPINKVNLKKIIIANQVKMNPTLFVIQQLTRKS